MSTEQGSQYMDENSKEILNQSPVTNTPDKGVSTTTNFHPKVNRSVAARIAGVALTFMGVGAARANAETPLPGAMNDPLDGKGNKIVSTALPESHSPMSGNIEDLNLQSTEGQETAPFAEAIEVVLAGSTEPVVRPYEDLNDPYFNAREADIRQAVDMATRYFQDNNIDAGAFRVVIPGTLETISGVVTPTPPTGDSRPSLLISARGMGILFNYENDVVDPYVYDNTDLLKAIGAMDPEGNLIVDQATMADLYVYPSDKEAIAAHRTNAEIEARGIPNTETRLLVWNEETGTLDTNESAPNQNVINIENYNGEIWPIEQQRVNASDTVTFEGVDEYGLHGTMVITDTEGNSRRIELVNDGTHDNIRAEDNGIYTDVNVVGTLVGILGTRTVTNLQTVDSQGSPIEQLSFNSFDVIDFEMATYVDGKLTTFVVSIPANEIYWGEGTPVPTPSAQVLETFVPGRKFGITIINSPSDETWGEYLDSIAKPRAGVVGTPGQQVWAYMDEFLPEYRDALAALGSNSATNNTYAGITHEVNTYF